LLLAISPGYVGWFMGSLAARLEAAAAAQAGDDGEGEQEDGE
jgi:hypothetical protein